MHRLKQEHKNFSNSDIQKSEEWCKVGQSPRYKSLTCSRRQSILMSHSIMCIAIVSPHTLAIPGRNRDVEGEENTSLSTRSFSYLSHHSPLSLIIMSSCIQCCPFPSSVHLQSAGLWRRDHGLYAISSFLNREAPALGWPCNLYKPFCKEETIKLAGQSAMKSI